MWGGGDASFAPQAKLVDNTLCFIFQLLLLNWHVRVNVQDNEGNTPIHLATGNGHEDVSSFVHQTTFL